MNRQEAIGVVTEVVNACKCFLDVTHVSITDSKFQIRMKSTDYEIYIKCYPNDDKGMHSPDSCEASTEDDRTKQRSNHIQT